LSGKAAKTAAAPALETDAPKAADAPAEDVKKESAPDLNASFEQEFEEFMQVLEQEIENAPRPEKW